MPTIVACLGLTFLIVAMGGFIVVNFPPPAKDPARTVRQLRDECAKEVYNHEVWWGHRRSNDKVLIAQDAAKVCATLHPDP